MVGIGASAGALKPISELLHRLPPGCEIALVLVQHLDPNHESILVDLLNRESNLPVQWARTGQSVLPGNVYVAPPKSCLSIEHGVLLVREPSPSKGSSGDVDHFFHSLAEDRKHRAIAVILSGNGSDGTLGARAIKGAGGIVFAQEVSTASFPSMPRSAIAGGIVDQALTPTEIADELAKVAQRAPLLWQRIGEADAPLGDGTEAGHMTAVLRLLAMRRGVDFNEYKPTTIKRRVVRQMILSKCADFAEYLKLLERDAAEIDKLYESLLINVTEFFRDPDYFEFLRGSILPQMLENHSAEHALRIWVPGCSTGEEAYSIGMLIRELLEERSQSVPVQIFGTDVSERMITMARAGLYSPADVANVTPERLKRFFHHTDLGYVVHKDIRDMCIFARQNVAKDSPFSRLDMISCRNLLIYLNPNLQRKLMPIFHYSLNPGGYLVLGSSESVGGHADLYRLVDRRFRIYSRKSSGHRATFDFAVERSAGLVPLSRPPASMQDALKESTEIIQEADRIVLNRHGPTGVLVNDEMEILQFRGDVSAYLFPPPGRASLNLFRMAREGLGGELQAAINEAREKSVRVRRTDVRIAHGDIISSVEVDVTPIDTARTRERFYLVLFAPAADAQAPDRPVATPAVKSKKARDSAQVEQLRQDLEATRNYLQTAIQKHEATNQELRAANEEIQSSNEELQSTNEELETAKEELQSTNEELTTVNEELHSRQLDLIQVNNDLHNLINSVHVPIIILDQEMRIRRFTPMAERVLKVIPTDIGRPLSDINIELGVTDLPQLIAEVMDTLTLKEVEVKDAEGRWMSLRLRPYKTADNKIDGVVLTLFDIDTIKRTLSEIEEARNLAHAVIETTREPLAALTPELVIKSANEAFYRMFSTTKERAEGRPFLEVIQEPEKLDALKRALESVLPTNTSLTNYEVGIDLPGTGPTALVINVRQIASALRSYPLILVSLHPR